MVSHFFFPLCFSYIDFSSGIFLLPPPFFNRLSFFTFFPFPCLPSLLSFSYSFPIPYLCPHSFFSFISPFLSFLSCFLLFVFPFLLLLFLPFVLFSFLVSSSFSPPQHYFSHLPPCSLPALSPTIPSGNHFYISGLNIEHNYMTK